MSYYVAFIYGVTAFYLYKFLPISTIIITLILLAIFSKNKILRALVIGIIVLSGFFYSYIRYTPQTPLEEISDRIVFIKGSPISDIVPLDGKGRYSQVLKIKEAFYDDYTPLGIKEISLVSEDLLYTDKLYFIKVRTYPYYMNPGGFKAMPSGYALEIKEMGEADFSSFQQIRQKARSRLNNYIRNNLSGESAPFIMSIVTGERRLLTKDIRDAFNATGLAHILSISGTHFGLLFIILFSLFRFIIKRLPYHILSHLTLYLTPSQIAAIISIPFMIGYLALSAMSVPSIRAFIMISLFLIGLLIGRKGFWLNSLLFAAFLIVLIHPEAILDLSFQLSFMAVLCIGIVAGHRLNQKGPDNYIKRYILSPALISLSAIIGTAPLVAYYFHYFSIVSLFTNIIITPFVGFIILPLALISSLVYLFSETFPFYFLIDKLSLFLIRILKYIAGWEYSSVNIPAFPPFLLILFTIGTLIFIFSIATREQSKNKGSFIANYPFALFVVMSIMPFVIYAGTRIFEYKGLSVTFLDVGQGDSSVVELPDKRTLVIDTGKNGFQTASFLRYKGIKKIDALVLSHASSDHANGLRYLIENFKISEIWDNGRIIYPEDLIGSIRIRGLKRGDMIEGRGYKILVLHPYDGFYTSNPKESAENNDSLVIKINGRERGFLFTGDIEHEATEDISNIGVYIKSHVIKVPHHGSRTSSNELFYANVSPEIAVISVGRNNRYGHPHKETIDILNNIRIFRTDRDGAIKIKELDNSKLLIRTFRDFKFSEVKTLSDEIRNIERLFMVW